MPPREQAHELRRYARAGALNVLSCDLVGSTRRAAGTDAEDWRALDLIDGKALLDDLG
jgi:hypothetical protein